MDFLNEILENEIKDLEIHNIYELQGLYDVIEITRKHKRNLSTPKYKRKYSVKESFMHSYNFLNSISPAYAAYLKKRADEGDLIIDVSNPPMYPQAFSNAINGEYKIYVPYRNNICTSYSITHELMHDTTIVGGENNATRTVFCEIFSLLGEKLQDKYFESIGHREWKTHAKENIVLIQEKAECLFLEYRWIETFLEKGYINSKDFYDILSELPSVDEYLVTHVLCVMGEKQLQFYLDQRYLFGDIYSDYIMDRINQTNCLQEFFDLNEMLNYYSIKQFLTYLDLEWEDEKNILHLTKESCQKLEDSYVQKIKKIG